MQFIFLSYITLHLNILINNMNRVQEKLPDGSSGYNIVGYGFSQTFQRTLNLPAEKIKHISLLKSQRTWSNASKIS